MPRVTPILLIVAGLGCTSWQTPPTLTPEAIVNGKHPPTVRIELRDGSTMVLTGPSIQGEEIVGVGKPRGERVRLPLSEIRTVWIRELDKKRTIILAAGLATVATVAFVFRNDLGLGVGYQAVF